MVPASALAVSGIIDLLLDYGAKVPTIVAAVKGVIATFSVSAPDDPLAGFDTKAVIQILRERARANAAHNRDRIAELEAEIAAAEAADSGPSPEA